MAEEIIEELDNEPDATPTPAKQLKTNDSTVTFKKPTTGSSQKPSTFNTLVKRKQPLVLVKPKSTTQEIATATTKNEPAKVEESATSKGTSGTGGLSMLAAYSDSSEESE